jgi:hypothetical protein
MKIIDLEVVKEDYDEKQEKQEFLMKVIEV